MLHDLILEGKLDLYLNEEQKESLLKVVDSLKKDILYKSDFHGLHHSEKDLLFGYLLGIHEGLSLEELEILTDASMYHDIGRMNDYEDEFHGYASALKLEELFGSKPVYQNKENLEILKAMCDAHSIDDSRMERILSNYEISPEKKETALKLAKLLKDADSLDRTRFRKTSKAALKEHFLRFNYSRELIPLAYQVNEYYRDKICENYCSSYARENTGELLHCYHGIGFNFPTLDSILDNGILSEYAKKKKGINSARNFQGNNGAMWIALSCGEGEAKKLFVDKGISFECLAPHLIKGEKDASYAKSKELPVDSRRYRDERFAFYEIPVENIISIRINPELLDLDISTLNYLMGSTHYETLENNINVYLNYLITKFDYSPNTDLIDKLKNDLKNKIVAYEKLDYNNQIKEQERFLFETDEIKLKINAEIARMIKEAFSNKLGKTNITVFDVITYILNSKKIDYDFSYGKFNLRNREKKI